MCSTAIKLPTSAHTAGSQPWSAQQRTAHNTPMLSHTPTHGSPVSRCAAAITRPVNGGYLDAYTGRISSCSVSKCSASGGVGFASLPDANVSLASR